MPGIARATYMPFPFQIIQGTDTIMIAYPFASASRLIHLYRRQERNAQLLEFKCVPFSEELLYGHLRRK